MFTNGPWTLVCLKFRLESGSFLIEFFSFLHLKPAWRKVDLPIKNINIIIRLITILLFVHFIDIVVFFSIDWFEYWFKKLSKVELSESTNRIFQYCLLISRVINYLPQKVGSFTSYLLYSFIAIYCHSQKQSQNGTKKFDKVPVKLPFSF